MTIEVLPPSLAEIVETVLDLAAARPAGAAPRVLQQVPPLPSGCASTRSAWSRSPSASHPCSSAPKSTTDRLVHLFVDVPPEAPTTRGFAGIMLAGLDGLPADEVLAVPGDVTARLGLAEVVSPLRLRGATALLSRIQRQVREQLAAA